MVTFIVLEPSRAFLLKRQTALRVLNQKIFFDVPTRALNSGIFKVYTIGFAKELAPINMNIVTIT